MPKIAKTRRQPHRGPIRAAAPLSPPASQNINNTTSNHADGEGAKLLKQAEALATMSVEVNLRALSTLAHKLQDDVKKLVLRTSDDQDFRRENEERMTRIMYEVHTVKSFMATLQGQPPATRADIDKVQQEMRETSTKWHKQIEDMEVKLDALSAGMKQPSKPAVTKTANLDPITPDTTSRETRAMTKAKTELQPSIQKQQTSFRSSTPESRIQDAIDSTKRWNREHKTTKLRDSHFITSYFRKQTQRDAELGGILQRTLQRRMANKAKARFDPQNLEELSRHAVWKDVIDMATEVLVVNKMRTAQLLG
ncbi:hypothetical protein FSPOR_11414 [Fusarium sporotrichioides]|uniref:Uncharacterized protein n=1 Tax=Fusarium sporotrichioides TaxID=5514 RepID=A0A395RGR8_FUSSP|nr:hypothetical protein FSPOR_11414 [Fusarium sporotrichioides]